MEVVGIKRCDFRANDGNQISGYQIFTLKPIEKTVMDMRLKSFSCLMQKFSLALLFRAWVIRSRLLIINMARSIKSWQ